MVWDLLTPVEGRWQRLSLGTGIRPGGDCLGRTFARDG